MRGSSWPPVSSAVTPGMSCRARNVSGPLVTTVRSRTSPRRAARRCKRRRGVDADGAARADQVDQLLGDAVLGARVLAEAVGELLGPDRDAPPRMRWADALLGEHVEVAPDRHLADVELGGELGDAHAAVGVEAVSR